MSDPIIDEIREQMYEALREEFQEEFELMAEERDYWPRREEC